MGVSLNGGTPKSSILIGFSMIFTIHFGVPRFSETSIWSSNILFVLRLFYLQQRPSQLAAPIRKGFVFSGELLDVAVILTTSGLEG